MGRNGRKNYRKIKKAKRDQARQKLQSDESKTTCCENTIRDNDTQNKSLVGVNGTFEYTTLGCIHQGLHFFENSGLQCTGICLESFRYSLHKPVNIWTPNDIDEVIYMGDRFYNKCISGKPKMLQINQLPNTFNTNGFDYKLDIIEKHTKVGFVMQEPSQQQEQVFVSLSNALQEAFLHSPLCLSRETIVSSTHFEDMYYVFDSHCRSNEGLYSENDGYAVLTCFSNLMNLHQFLLRLFQSSHVQPDDLFEIIPIHLSCYEESSGC